MSTTAALAPVTVPQWGMFFHEEAHLDITTQFKKRDLSTSSSTASLHAVADTSTDSAEAANTTIASATTVATPAWSMFFHAAPPEQLAKEWHEDRGMAATSPTSFSQPEKRSVTTVRHMTTSSARTAAAAAAAGEAMVRPMTSAKHYQINQQRLDDFLLAGPDRAASASASSSEPAAGAAVVDDAAAAAPDHDFVQNQWSQFWHDPSWHPENKEQHSPRSSSLSSSSSDEFNTLQAAPTPTEAASVTISSSALLVLFGVLAGGTGPAMGLAAFPPMF
jgi:hypothetical protein